MGSLVSQQDWWVRTVLSEGLCLESAHAPGLAGEAEQKTRQSRVAAEARTEFGDMQEGRTLPQAGVKMPLCTQAAGGGPAHPPLLSFPVPGRAGGRGEGEQG